MANYTKHYQLHQWEPGDAFLRTDFNEDLSKVDEALFQLASQKYGEDKKVFVLGSYIGDGGTGLQDIPLAFQPSLLYLFNCDPTDDHDIYRFALGTGEIQCAFDNTGITWVRDGIFYMTLSGFQLNGDAFPRGEGFNTAGVTYHYVAFR